MMLTLSPLGDSVGEARAEGKRWRKFTLQHSKSKFIQSSNKMQGGFEPNQKRCLLKIKTNVVQRCQMRWLFKKKIHRAEVLPKVNNTKQP